MTQPATRADWLLVQSQQHFQKLAALAARAEGAQQMGKIAAHQQFAQGLPTIDSNVGRVIDTEGMEKEAISGLAAAVKGGLHAAKGAYQSARAGGVGAVKAVGRALKPGLGGVRSTHQQFRQQYGLLRSGGAGRVKALKGAESRMKAFAPGQYKPGTTGGSVTTPTGRAFGKPAAAPKPPTPAQPAGTPAAGGGPAGAPKAQAPAAPAAPAAPGNAGTVSLRGPATQQGGLTHADTMFSGGKPGTIATPPQTMSMGRVGTQFGTPPPAGGAPAPGMPQTMMQPPPMAPSGTFMTPPPAGMPAATPQTMAVPPPIPRGTQAITPSMVLEPGEGVGRLAAGAAPPPIPQGAVRGAPYRAPGGTPPAPTPPAAPQNTMFGEAMESAMGGAAPRNIPAQQAMQMTPAGARNAARNAARAERAAAAEAVAAERAARKGVPKGVDVDVAGAVPTAPAAPSAAAAADDVAAAAAPRGAAAADDAAAAATETAKQRGWIAGLPWGKALLGAGLVGGGLGAAGLAMGAGQALQQSGAPYAYGRGAPFPGQGSYQM